MMTNCDWFISKLEAYFCDGLSSEELQRCQTHLAACAECSGQVESLKDIDPLVRGVFQRRLAVARLAAQTNTRPRLLKLALAGAGMAVAAVVLGIGMMFMQRAPAPRLVINPPEVPAPAQTEIKKDTAKESPGNRNLAKPTEGTPAMSAPQPHLDIAAENGPEFAITDAAGYTATLETYRGRVFLFGVVSPEQKAAVVNLQRIYDTFGANRGIRILGVSRRREDTLEGATLPMFFNHGSKLLGVGDGQFLLIDADGKTRLGGSLSDPASMAQLRNQLGQLGIR